MGCSIPVAGAQLWGSLAVPRAWGLWAALLLQTQGGCSDRPGPVCHFCSGSGMVQWELLGCSRPLLQELMVMGKDSEE